MPLTKLNILN